MNIFQSKWLKTGIGLIYTTIMRFANNNGFKYSASLAYYTVFSLAPLTMLMVFIVGIYFGNDAFNGHIYPQIKNFVGPGAATEIQSIIKSIHLGKAGIPLTIGVITVILGAAGVFLDMQDSLNTIWRVRAKPKRGWVKLLQNRLLSFSLVISIGLLLLLALIINSITDAVSADLNIYFRQATLWFFSVFNFAFTFLVITTLFAIIFKFLPDVKIGWRNVRAGAFFTAVLFMLARYVIGLYLKSSSLSNTYGAAGSIIIIFAWIYYTSALLYIGAEFTQVYAEFKGTKIEPADYAVSIEQIEIAKAVEFLPDQEPVISNELL